MIIHRTQLTHINFLSHGITKIYFFNPIKLRYLSRPKLITIHFVVSNSVALQIVTQKNEHYFNEQCCQMKRFPISLLVYFYKCFQRNHDSQTLIERIERAQLSC